MSDPSNEKAPLSGLRRLVRKGIDKAGLDPVLFRYYEWSLARKGARDGERLNSEAWPKTDPDGLALPSAYLMTLVAGHADWRGFLSTGKNQLDVIADLVERNGGVFRAAERVLDLGCGCGRISRHVPAISQAALFGVDYNPRLVKWCAGNLPGNFTQNQLTPPLSFPDNHFDAVWLLSVFTHLRMETQDAWLKELARILKPGGTAVITFHDEDHPGVDVAGLDRDQLLETGHYIHNDRAEGSNFISTFQTRAAVRAQFGQWFEVQEIVPSQSTALIQAASVLRKS